MELNNDGLPPNQPVTAQQIREAELRRKERENMQNLMLIQQNQIRAKRKKREADESEE